MTEALASFVFWLIGNSSPRVMATLAVAVAVGLLPGIGLAQEASPEATSLTGGLGAAVAWLVAQQAEDGGFPGFDGTSDPGTTCDAVYALAAAGAVGLDVARPLADAYAFLEASALEYAQTGVGQSAKLALAAVAAGDDPGDVAGVHSLELVEMGADPTTGLYGAGIFDHALGILALAAAGEEVPTAAFESLASTQIADGSWAFDGATTEGAGDSNTTALVVQALVAGGQGDSSMVPRAVGYLSTVQVESGGFVFQPGESTLPDANSTALAVQALTAVGMDPSAPDLLDAAGALAAFQNGSGAFRYSDELPDDNLLATAHAIPALAGLPLPVVPADGAGATPAA